MAAAAAIPEGPAMDSVGNTSNSTLRTLDEPVCTTITRDLMVVYEKVKLVMVPVGVGNSQEQIGRLRSWDLWGPLILCLILSITLSLGASAEQSSLVFTSVFMLMWGGSAVITLNAQLLGGQQSFFQTVSILGYASCPLVIAAVLGSLWSNGVFRAICTLAAITWASRAALVFLQTTVEERRRLLVLYPAVLFYIVLGWLVYVQ